MKGKIITLILAGFMLLPVGLVASAEESANANKQHIQEAEVNTSGGIFVGTQRQSKGENSTQSLTIKKSGGIILIIQRNLNCRVKDLEKMFNTDDNKKNEG